MRESNNYKIRIIDKDSSNEIIEQVANMIEQEWGYQYKYPAHKYICEEINQAIVSSTLPKIFYVIDLKTREAMATCSLLESDIDEFPEFSPWLANLYVKVGWRNKGIGTKLAKATQTHARSLGFGKLYLFTDEAVGWYTKQGWSRVKEFTYANKIQQLLVYKLDT